MCVCVRVCAAWHNTRTHTFFGGLQQQFFRSSQTQKTSSLWPHCSCEYVSPSSTLPLPLPPSTFSCLPAWFITSIVLRGKCILRIAFHCCQHLFLQAGSLPFPSRSIFACPFLLPFPFLPTYLPTYYSHSHRLSRGVKFVSPHSHTHSDLSCILTESNEACKGYIGVWL